MSISEQPFVFRAVPTSSSRARVLRSFQPRITTSGGSVDPSPPEPVVSSPAVSFVPLIPAPESTFTVSQPLVTAPSPEPTPVRNSGASVSVQVSLPVSIPSQPARTVPSYQVQTLDVPRSNLFVGMNIQNIEVSSDEERGYHRLREALIRFGDHPGFVPNRCTGSVPDPTVTEWNDSEVLKRDIIQLVSDPDTCYWLPFLYTAIAYSLAQEKPEWPLDPFTRQPLSVELLAALGSRWRDFEGSAQFRHQFPGAQDVDLARLSILDVFFSWNMDFMELVFSASGDEIEASLQTSNSRILNRALGNFSRSLALPTLFRRMGMVSFQNAWISIAEADNLRTAYTLIINGAIDKFCNVLQIPRTDASKETLINLAHAFPLTQQTDRETLVAAMDMMKRGDSNPYPQPFDGRMQKVMDMFEMLNVLNSSFISLETSYETTNRAIAEHGAIEITMPEDQSVFRTRLSTLYQIEGRLLRSSTEAKLTVNQRHRLAREKVERLLNEFRSSMTSKYASRLSWREIVTTVLSRMDDDELENLVVNFTDFAKNKVFTTRKRGIRMVLADYDRILFNEGENQENPEQQSEATYEQYAAEMDARKSGFRLHVERGEPVPQRDLLRRYLYEQVKQAGVLQKQNLANIKYSYAALYQEFVKLLSRRPAPTTFTRVV